MENIIKKKANEINFAKVRFFFVKKFPFSLIFQKKEV